MSRGAAAGCRLQAARAPGTKPPSHSPELVSFFVSPDPGVEMLRCKIVRHVDLECTSSLTL